MSPISIKWYLELGRKHILSSWWATQFSFFTMCSSYVFAEAEDCSLSNLCKNWDPIATLQLPSDFWVVFWTRKAEKQNTITFCTDLPKKGTGFDIWKCHVKMTKHGKNLLIWKCHLTMTNKRGVYKYQIAAKKIILWRSFTKKINSFGYQHSVLFTHGLQHYGFLRTVSVCRLCGLWQMPTDLDNFFGPKVIPFTWM